MRDEIGKHAPAVAGYVLRSQLNDGPNAIILPTVHHQLEATAETVYNCISFCRNPRYDTYAISPMKSVLKQNVRAHHKP
jgi:hypothetical protein